MIPDILHSLQKPDLFEKFKIQLNRDFELSGLIEYAPKILSNDIDHVYDAVLDAVLLVERKDSNSIMTLLYRIDITEQQLKKASGESSNNLKQAMAQLIIKRVLQKVIIKEQFSK